MLGELPKAEQCYKAVALGGTFDFLHKGHEQLISHAFDIGEKVLIGVTSDQLARKLRKTHPVQTYAVRVKQLRIFLRAKRWLRRTRISPLHDPYGPAARRKDLEALVITPNTLFNALMLNRLRKRKKLRVLKITKVPLAKAEDGKPISSTRIRSGEIDRLGRLRHKA